MNSTVDISVIIVTYNSASVINACLASLAAERDSSAMEVLVIDNGSTDTTLQIVRSYDWATLLTGHGNVGFAKGNNIGFAKAAGRYLFMLNPDTEVRAGALAGLVSFADANPKAGMIAPHVVNPDDTLQHNTFRFPSIKQAFYGFFNKFVDLDSEDNGRWPASAYQETRPAEHILGAALLLRREVWETLGGMDERYALYFEETDWCYRVAKAGWEIWYTPSATIMHIGGHSTSKNPERSSTLFARSQAYYYRKNYGWATFILLKLITVAGLAYWSLRTLKDVVRRRIDGAVFKRRVASYWNILTAWG